MTILRRLWRWLLGRTIPDDVFEYRSHPADDHHDFAEEWGA